MSKPRKGGKPASRSGPSLQRHERTRKITQFTLSDDARAVLEKASADLDESKSALVEALILSHLAGDQILPPALLRSAEELRALRTRDGRKESLLDVLTEALDVGIDALLNS